jgi:hypothetical protein
MAQTLLTHSARMRVNVGYSLDSKHVAIGRDGPDV